MLEERIVAAAAHDSVRFRNLGSTISHRVKALPANADILIGHQNVENIYVLLEGWAIRYCTFPDGRRQISAVLIAGDICHLDTLSETPLESAVSTITPVRVAVIPRRALHALAEVNPSVARGLLWETFASASVQAEWTVNVGRRTAAERLGHLFCEIYVRLQAMGEIQLQGCYFPLTQSDLADMMGLTPVHINRTLQMLRAADLVILNRRRLTIPDFAALQRYSLFDSSYLHIQEVMAARAAMVAEIA